MIATEFIVMALVRQDEEVHVTLCNTTGTHIFANQDDADAFLWRELAAIDYRWLKHTADNTGTEWWIVADLCPDCKLAGEHTSDCIN
jgi:hypothetical protein